MFLIFTLLVFLLADVGAQGGSIKLLSDENMKTIFKKVHGQFELRNLEWVDGVAERALEKSHLSPNAYTDEKKVVLVGRGAFGKVGDIEEKLRDSLTDLLKKYKDKIPPNARYGCHGFATIWEERHGFLNIACIYRKTRA